MSYLVGLRGMFVARRHSESTLRRTPKIWSLALVIFGSPLDLPADRQAICNVTSFLLYRTERQNYQIRQCKTPQKGVYTIPHFLFLLYPLDFLKQSIHFRFDVSRGSNGNDVIAALQPLHFQSPSNRGLSPLDDAGRVLPPFCFW